jgi:poly(hydroxyalkanoate) depolymerase family esterase
VQQRIGRRCVESPNGQEHRLPRTNSHLREIGVFANPGNLRGWAHVPADLPREAPLVVVLHGCTQDAAGYDRHSGWSRLAERQGFALLLPEQQRSNNANLCFNWFLPGDSRRDQGEPASIRAMIEAMVEAHGLDRSRIFVTGLSAGGAMAATLLATYPEVFAAGAIIAGIPFGCASSVAQAFDCMGGSAAAEPEALAERVRRASPHKGPWPRISVWQGSADRTVAPANGEAIARQWAALHGLGFEPSRVDRIDGYPRRIWADQDGRIAVEQVSVTGMGHGTPLRPGTGEGESGLAGAHMLDAAISSTDHIAAFFGIAQAPATAASRERADRAATPSPRPRVRAFRRPEAAGGVQGVIEDALRKAGLMR